jgi:hypothetical protein
MLLHCVTQVDWKLNYGKWRPRLLDFAKAAAVRICFIIMLLKLQHQRSSDL